MPDYDLVVRSRRTVLPAGEAPAAVGVLDGRIAAVDAYDAALPAASDADLGEVALLPGLVDTHVHVNEPGRTEWEGFATATRAAAAGGVTTVVDMPLNCLPPTVDIDALAIKRAAAAARCWVDVGFWGGAIPGNAGALAGLHDAGVFGFKCFLSPSGVDEFPPLELPELTEVARRIAEFDGLLIVHAEDPAHLPEAPRSPRYSDFLASRPAAAERSAVARLAELAQTTGVRIHVLHVSAAEVVPVVARARSAGARMTAETCPHYLLLAGDRIPDGLTSAKCCPPVRDAANAEALWTALGDGLLDCVVSDHSPCLPELKRGDFGTAWGGISSLQLGLPLVWTGARERGYGLGDVVRWMATAPARLAGLRHKGRIDPGADADLVAFDPAAPYQVDARALAHHHPVTPYDGWQLRGVVRRTWLRGAPVGDAPTGRLLHRAVTATQGVR